MNSNTYMKSSVYQHAALRGYDTGIRSLLYAELARSAGDTLLEDRFMKQAKRNFDSASQLERPLWDFFPVLFK